MKLVTIVLLCFENLQQDCRSSAVKFSIPNREEGGGSKVMGSGEGNWDRRKGERTRPKSSNFLTNVLNGRPRQTQVQPLITDF